jgi:hypothetical protein
MNYFAFMPLILSVFAVLAGGGLLVADEEKGTLDLVLAHPVRRTSLFIGRVAAFVVATLAVLAIAWAYSRADERIVGASQRGGDIAAFPVAVGVLLFYGMLAVLLSNPARSSSVPRRRPFKKREKSSTRCIAARPLHTARPRAAPFRMSLTGHIGHPATMPRRCRCPVYLVLVKQRFYGFLREL